MRLRQTVAIAAVLASALPAALAPARADDDHFRPYPPGAVAGRYAFVYRPAPVVFTIERLAAEIVNDAAYLRVAASRGRHHFDWREVRAIRNFAALEDAARAFHARARLATREPLRTGYDFERLVVAWEIAARSLDDLHPAGPFFLPSWDRLSVRMDRLADCYDRPAYWHARGARWNRAVIYRD